MTKPRVLLGMCLIIAVLIAAAWLNSQKTAQAPDLRAFSNASELEVEFKNVKVALKKPSRDWTIVSYAGQPTRDTRASRSLVTHLVDLLKTIDVTTSPKLDAKDAAAYTSSAELRVSAAGQSVVFGNPDVSGRLFHLYFPEQKYLTLLRTSVPALMAAHEPLDFRDRRITTFEVDDLEDFNTSPECRAYALVRDGDRWLWQSASKPAMSDTDQWLETLLGTRYEEIDEAETTGRHGEVVCKIILKGRKGRAETISLIKDNNGLWATNSALPASYRVPERLLETIIGPKRKTAPKAAAGS